MKNDVRIIEITKDNEFLKKEYFHFLSLVFPGADFTKWYEKGFWDETYIPISILNSDKIISNVSISIMKVLVNGKMQKAIQLGAVGTIHKYRNQGLSKILMNYVFEKYKDKANLFFLFANEGVLDFYPRFGFRRLNEKKFINDTNIPTPNFSAVKLDIQDENDYRLLVNLVKERQPLTKIFGAEEYGSITMWHIFATYSEHLYYLDKEDIILIKTEDKDNTHIQDIIYRKPFDIHLAISKILQNKINSIHYYFPPDQLEYKYNSIVNSESILFVKGDVELDNQQFKFPATGHT